MVGNPSPITTESQFQATLCTILVEATQNGVAVEDGWNCRSTDDDLPDWEVIIEEVEKPFPPPDGQ
jgi:hypothetical protein